MRWRQTSLQGVSEENHFSLKKIILPVLPASWNADMTATLEHHREPGDHTLRMAEYYGKQETGSLVAMCTHVSLELLTPDLLRESKCLSIKLLLLTFSTGI